MSEHTIRFLPHGRDITVPKGETIIRAALEAGVHINASCGGEGLCGKCRILIEEGEVADGLSAAISPEERGKGYRLACRAVVNGDAIVRVPVESEIDASVLQRPAASRCKARLVAPESPAPEEGQPLKPPAEKIYIEMAPPAAGDNASDMTRLIGELRRQCDEHRLVIDYDVIRRLPEVLRNACFKVTLTLLRPARPDGPSHIIDCAPGDTTGRHLAVAVDIGTTTVQGQLLDLVTGAVLAEGADFNAQISYGEDVITRIMTAEKGDGLEKLHFKVVETLNGIMAKLLKKAGVAGREVALVTLAGNTTMTQLLLRINPGFIRRSPYVPAGNFYPPLKASDLDLILNDHARVLCFPQISSYVGGDIVAGALAAGIHRSDDLTLFIDIGTNAEIVIGNRDWMACAACSAGPAFEGGGIEFGMRAARGAIEDFSIDPLTWEPMLLTIGNVRPKGICGSGLITTVATMFEMGIINSQGKFELERAMPRIREREGVWEYVLAWRDETQIDRDIALTEIDIENLIRAKGAIYSGCMTLLDEIGMDMGAIERIILAGGFGSTIDLDKAMAIGLLPETEPGRVTYIGNSSLSGARICALANHLRGEIIEMAESITNFELSETASYMDHYVAALFLPHTDLNLFPQLKARLENDPTIYLEKLKVCSGSR